jgi:hypothetical protein
MQHKDWPPVSAAVADSGLHDEQSAVLQGYVIYLQRQKLKPELVGRSNTEIRDLKKAGQVGV